MVIRNRKLFFISLIILLLTIYIRSALPHQVFFFLFLGIGFIVMSFSYMSFFSLIKKEEIVGKIMGKLKNIFTNQKELPKWVLPLVILFWLMEITEYGHRPFVEGFMDDFTDPLLYYIFIGVGIVSLL